MTTYGKTELMVNARPRAYRIDDVKQRNTIAYREFFYNHFQFRDAVNAKNSMQMFPLAL